MAILLSSQLLWCECGVLRGQRARGHHQLMVLSFGKVRGDSCRKRGAARHSTAQKFPGRVWLLIKGWFAAALKGLLSFSLSALLSLTHSPKDLDLLKVTRKDGMNRFFHISLSSVRGKGGVVANTLGGCRHLAIFKNYQQALIFAVAISAIYCVFLYFLWMFFCQ